MRRSTSRERGRVRRSRGGVKNEVNRSDESLYKRYNQSINVAMGVQPQSTTKRKQQLMMKKAKIQRPKINKAKTPSKSKIKNQNQIKIKTARCSIKERKKNRMELGGGGNTARKGVGHSRGVNAIV